MSENRSKARHRRSKSALAAGVPLALTAAGTLAYGTDFGLFGEDAQRTAAGTVRSSP